MIMLALMMVSASVSAWMVAGAAPREPRPYIRIASALFLAFGIAGAIGETLARPVGLIAMATGPALLTLAVPGAGRHPPPGLASLALVAASACGIAAAVADRPSLAMVPLVIAVASMVGATLAGSGAGPLSRGPQVVAASLSFLAGGCVDIIGGVFAQPGLMLFSSAGLLGLSLALARDSDASIEEQRTGGLRRRAIR
jgi:hypothetical protein